MKRKNKLLFPLCLAFTVALAASAASCEQITDKFGSGSTSVNSSVDNGSDSSSEGQTSTSFLNVQADKTLALRGDVVTLSAFIRTEGQDDVPVAEDDVVYTIVEGGDFATLVGNKLTVSNTATANAVIKVKATVGTTDSNTIDIKVSVPLTGIEISVLGNVTSVRNGSSVVLQKAITPDGADLTNFKWVITEGADYCMVSGDVLVVAENAPIGTSIKVKAVCGDKTSNEISLIVGIPLNSVSISLAGSANVDPGKSRPITVTCDPTDATMQTVTWVFTQGEDACTIANNTLFVNDDAVIGTQISFYAQIGDKTSTPINVTVGTLITSIAISASETEIVKGDKAFITANVLPETATAAYSWVITEGADHASIQGGWLSVNKDAPTDTVIKVKAVSGDTESNELSFTVLPTQEEINNSKFYLLIGDDNVTVDARGNTATTLTAKLYNYNRVEVTDKDISFQVTEGEEYLELTDEGNYCSFVAKGHGAATVEVFVDGIEVEAETATVNVVVPPDAVTLPEVFAQRVNYAYNYSMNKYTYSGNELVSTAKDELPFVATAKITTANPAPCLDVNYSFTHEDGSYGDEVGAWKDGKLTFNKTGKVTVTATSASGSVRETSVSYTFDINEGFNAYSFQEASDLLRKSYYVGQEVNFVALDILTDGDGNVYKYEFVPTPALKALSEQTPSDVSNSNTCRIVAVNKSAHINGNKHKVNASHLRTVTETEIQQLQLSGSKWSAHGALVSIEPYTESPKDHQIVGDFFANVYDLELEANAPITFTNEENPGAFKGAYVAALNIGNGDHIDSNYTVQVKNVTTSAARDGFRFVNVVQGTAENVYAYNCYQNGFFLRASVMKLSNITIGNCGAVGIELAPEDSAKAGVNNDQIQSITFDGTIDVTGNIQPPTTEYLKHYMGGAVPTLVNASILFNGLNDNQAAHLIDREMKLDESGNPIFGSSGLPEYDMKDLCLVTFSLHTSVLGTAEPNVSQAIYPSYQAGGIIDATALPKDGIDTTHQFIRLTVYQAQDQSLGYALIYNLNYGK